MIEDLSEDVIERELNRAINRTDFFRAFRMLADFHDIASFAVLRVKGHREVATLDRLCLLADVPGGKAALTPIAIADVERFFADLSGLRRPVFLTDIPPSLATVMRPRLLAIPAATEAGEKLVLLLGDALQQRTEEQIAHIVFDFSQAMRKLTSIEGLDTETPRFSQREVEVIEWTAEGKTSSEIAMVLGVSEYMVNEHIVSAMQKLDALNRIHLVTRAIRMGIIS